MFFCPHLFLLPYSSLLLFLFLPFLLSYIPSLLVFPLLPVFFFITTMIRAGLSRSSQPVPCGGGPRGEETDTRDSAQEISSFLPDWKRTKTFPHKDFFHFAFHDKETYINIECEILHLDYISFQGEEHKLSSCFCRHTLLIVWKEQWLTARWWGPRQTIRVQIRPSRLRPVTKLSTTKELGPRFLRALSTRQPAGSPQLTDKHKGCLESLPRTETVTGENSRVPEKSLAAEV